MGRSIDGIRKECKVTKDLTQYGGKGLGLLRLDQIHFLTFGTYFVAAMSLKEAGKLLESKVYDTLQLQVNMCTLWLFYIAVKLYVLVIFMHANSFNGISKFGRFYFVKQSESAKMLSAYFAWR